jgi:ParB-like chromosome segregation protein Spo0J
VSMRLMPPIHPAAARLRSMTTEEYAALVESIREHGQQEPVVMHEGAILDGRHRWQACAELGIDPLTTVWAGACKTPTAFVGAMNIPRRHMTASERAAYAVETQADIAKEIAEAERLRKAEAAKLQRPAGTTSFVSTPSRLTECSEKEQTHPDVKRAHQRESRTLAAKAAGASTGYMSQAAVIKEHAPEIFDDVLQGKITIPKAKRELARQDAAQDNAVFQQGVEVADTDGLVASRRLRAAFARAISDISNGLLPLNPTDTAAVLTDSLNQRARALRSELDEWFSAFEAAQVQPFTLVGAGS